MGHALNGSLQDALIRWHRMRGFNTLWQPGYDHAGISTQGVVEKELLKEGTSRQELGREAFVQRVWSGLHEYGGSSWAVPTARLLARLRARALHDGRRLRPRRDALLRAPVRARLDVPRQPDHQLVHRLQDVDLRSRGGVLRRRRRLDVRALPLVGGGGSVTVATVRPATILADVAVAVHPNDERYTALIGKDVVVPVVGRIVPVIADERVDPEFGTGALKITPGHDPTDFEIGRDHGFPVLTVIDFDGRMTGDVPEDYIGLTEDEAAVRVVAWLKEYDSSRSAITTGIRSAIATVPARGSSRSCRSSVCAMDELAKPAIEAIESGRVKFHPPVHAEWPSTG